MTQIGEQFLQKSSIADEQTNRFREIARRLHQRRKRNYWACTELHEAVTFPRLKPLPYLKESRLIQLAQQGDTEARNAVWIRHVGLAMSIVNRFHVPRELVPDALQEATLGLERAIMRFDVYRYNAFSTYAVYWIGQRVRRFLDEHRFRVRVPVYIQQEFRRLLACIDHCQDFADVQNIHRSYGGLKPSYFDAFLRFCALQRAEPLTRRAEVTNATDPSNTLDALDRVRRIRRMIKKLDPREQAVLQLRYGLDGQPELTLEEIAARFNLTRERVRQIQVEVETRLRNLLEGRVIRLRRRKMTVINQTQDGLDSAFGRSQGPLETAR